MSKWASLLIAIKKEFPKFQLVEKESSKWMNFLYTVFLMKYWNKDFMTSFTTTSGNTIYMPKKFIATDTGYRILRHELVHLKDSKGIRMVYFGLSYVLLLPVVVTMRAYWEFRAYKETMRVEYETTGNISDKTVDFIAEQFTSSGYLWMFPFPKTIKKLLNKAKLEIIEGK